MGSRYLDVTPAQAGTSGRKNARRWLAVPAFAGMMISGAGPACASTGADVAHAVNPWVALAYLVAGVLFILSLRGLSSPASSRRGNRFGMVGMLIAVVTTLVTHDIAGLPEILIAIAIGGGIGWVIARKIAMTDMPQLVAAFHSLVGLAAVLVGWAAYLNPGAFEILKDGVINPVSRVEMGLGIAIGAITSTVNDIILTLGFLSLTGLQFDLSTVAAILTIVGYSLNDTVVIYDRVRENLRRFKKMPLGQLLDLSDNEMLARTVMTSVTTFLALLALYLLGGEVIRSFVASMLFGVCIGTLSSIFIAAPVLVFFHLRPVTQKEMVEAEQHAAHQLPAK